MQPAPISLITRQVPLPLAAWAIRHNKIGLLSTFLALRQPQGWTTATPSDIATATGRNIKTVKAHIARLLALGWIGTDKAGRIYTRDIEKLSKAITGEKTTHRIVLGMADIKRQVLASMLAIWTRYGRFLLRKGGKNGVPLPTEQTPGISSTVIARKFHMSKAWAVKWRNVLEREGLIKVTRRTTDETITERQLWQARSYYPEAVTHCRLSGGRVVRNLASIVEVKVGTLTKKNRWK